jgi:hypothetical protein
VWWRISLGAPRRNNSARARYRPPALRFIRVPRRSSEVRDLYKKKKKSSLFFIYLFFDSPARQMSKMMMYTEPGPEQIYKQMVKSTELERIASRSTSQSHKKKKERKTKQSYQTTSIRHTHTHTRRVISVQGDLNEI